MVDGGGGGARVGLIHRDALTVNGRTVEENVRDAKCWNREVITAFEQPFKPHGGIVVLRGNLAPDGAVLKPSAASPHLMKHKGTHLPPPRPPPLQAMASRALWLALFG